MLDENNEKKESLAKVKNRENIKMCITKTERVFSLVYIFKTFKMLRILLPE